jgi:hypothetical protein
MRMMGESVSHNENLRRARQEGIVSVQDIDCDTNEEAFSTGRLPMGAKAGAFINHKVII